MQDNTTPLQLRDAVIIARQKFGRGEISIDALYATADAYILSLKEYKRTSGKRFTIPSRAYVIRSL